MTTNYGPKIRNVGKYLSVSGNFGLTIHIIKSCAMNPIIPNTQILSSRSSSRSVVIKRKASTEGAAMFKGPVAKSNISFVTLISYAWNSLSK